MCMLDNLIVTAQPALVACMDDLQLVAVSQSEKFVTGSHPPVERLHNAAARHVMSAHHIVAT